MCLRSGPDPVFMDPGWRGGTFLDDLIGMSEADRLRLWLGYRPVRATFSSPYGLPCGIDSYLACCFSSPWALGVFLLSCAAGATLPSQRKTALLMLGAGAIISLLDTGIRVSRRAEQGIIRDRIMEVLPIQIGVNFVFQILLPVGMAFIVTHSARTVRRLAIKVR